MFNNEASVCLCVFASCWLRPMSAEQIYVATVTAVPLMCRWGTSRPRSRWTEEQISSERTKLWIHKYFPARTLFAVCLCLCLMHICNFHTWCPPQIIRTGNPTVLNLLGCFCLCTPCVIFFPPLRFQNPKRISVSKERRWFIFLPCFPSHRHPHFQIYLSCLAVAGSQNPIGISISSYLPIYPSIFLSFSPSLQLSSLCTIGRNITWSI